VKDVQASAQPPKNLQAPAKQEQVMIDMSSQTTLAAPKNLQHPEGAEPPPRVSNNRQEKTTHFSQRLQPVMVGQTGE